MATDITTAIVVGVFSVMSAAVSATATYLVTSLQQQATNKRTEADYLFEKRVNALMDLNSCIHDFRRELAMAEANIEHGDPDEIYPELESTFYDCAECLTKAEVFLDEYQSQTIYDFLDECRAKAAYLDWQLMEGDPNPPESAKFQKEDYEKYYADTCEIMNQELREPIRDLREE